MRRLLEEVIIPAYRLNRVGDGVGLPEMDDGATIPVNGRHVVFTTDTYTVKPLFFPGDDMGRLAVCGTINDIAMMGATPLALFSSITVEDGLPIDVLKRIVASMSGTLEEIGIPLIAGDTKVVERGGLDEILVNASGIGVAETVVIDAGLKPGDRIILSGTIGNHELALLASREGLRLMPPSSPT